MSGSPVPPEYRRDDWPRLVAGKVNNHEGRIATLEAGGGGGGGVPDGDKGDITVSAGGTVWTIDNGTVTLAKQANMATASVVYRKTAGAGPPEVQSLATLKADLGLSGTNTGDQTTISGNAGSATVLQTSRNFSISGGGVTAAAVGFNGSADVVLSASVDAGHITLARMANVASGTLFYRKTAGAGAPETQTLATLKTDLGLAGTNSGDQTITLTGDVTGSGTGSFAATLATVNANVGTFGSSSAVPVITANAKGLITSVSTAALAAVAASGSASDLTTGTVPAPRTNHGIAIAHVAHAYAY